MLHVEQKFYIFEYRFNNEELENDFNDFFRLQAIRIESDDDIEEIKPENPFGDDPAF